MEIIPKSSNHNDAPVAHSTSQLALVSTTTISLSQTKMRAILIKDTKGPSKNLYLGEAPTPTVGPMEVLIQARNDFIETTLD